MSSRIKVHLPLIDFDCIVKSLDTMKEKYRIIDSTKIIVEADGYYRNMTIKKAESNRYSFYGEDIFLNRFTPRFTETYKRIYGEKIRQAEEAERKRLEEERIRYVAQQRQSIIENAKKMGYTVQETVQEEEIKLVLVKRVYD